MQVEDYFDFQDPDRICIKGSQVGIEKVLAEYLDRDRRPEEIVHCFPGITLDRVYATILYYLQNKESVDLYLQARSQGKKDEENGQKLGSKRRPNQTWEEYMEEFMNWDENEDEDIIYPEPVRPLAKSLKHYGRTRKEQIRINKQLLEKFRAWNNEELTEEELEEARQTWERAKKIIDENRSRKLFS
ncbi:MAG: DUF433 domain-containing protein [Cyanobacteria bacterium P01_E01_bin.42]